MLFSYNLYIPTVVLQPPSLAVGVWAPPRSLTATDGISYDVFSSGYLDVSVHRVPFLTLRQDIPNYIGTGCPIQKPTTITPAKGLIVDIVLKHTSFFGSNYLGIHH